MTNYTRISVVSTAEAALRKLKKAQVGVYDCKKTGAEFAFSVKDKYVEKVFAIFAKPCYNVRVIKKSKTGGFLSFIAYRAGLVAGAAMFIALALISQTFVLKIKVSGSGSYLEPEVRRIVLDEGAGKFKPYSAFNQSVATGRILALPQVTFCNIERRGSVLTVDVQVDEEHYGSASLKPLVSDADGVVKNIVAICGTAAVSAGDSVKRGDTLIYAHELSGEETIKCLAAGYAEIECAGTAEYFADAESDENLKKAYASAMLESESVLTRTHTVKPADGGVVYEIKFTYLHKVSINLS